MLLFLVTGMKCMGPGLCDCDPKHPCKYGTCVNEEGGYRCECDPGFKGDRCETDIDDCALNPCRNGASCINNVGQGYTCACKSGFRGKKCEFEISKCESNPCLNGGKCLGMYTVNGKSPKRMKRSCAKDITLNF